MSEKVLPITGEYSTDDYPYGRLRATAKFSVEFNPKKGFRSVFQTKNPKTGRINKPKKGTYQEFLYLVQNPANDHFEWKGTYIRGFEDINHVIDVLIKNGKDLKLTPEMIEYLYGAFFAVFRGNMMYVLNDSNKEELMPYVKDRISCFVKGMKSKSLSSIKDCKIDIKKIDNAR
jgi:hypothetical protein